MFNVLRAYASYDPQIGYCQGMGFITGLFLAHVGEEVRRPPLARVPGTRPSDATAPGPRAPTRTPPCARPACARLPALARLWPPQEAFWLLVAVIDRCGMRGLFSVDMPDFPHVMHTLETQLARHMPALSEHLAEQGVQPSMFASQVRGAAAASAFLHAHLDPRALPLRTQWMITVFTSNFPFDVVTRVWDVFLAEGWTAVYRAALGVLSLAQGARPRMSPYRTVASVRSFSADPLTQTSCSSSTSRAPCTCSAVFRSRSSPTNCSRLPCGSR